jgi:hypothetical protein
MNLGANNVHIIKGNGHATNRNGVGIHPQQSFSKGIAPRQKNQTRIIRL